MGEPSHHQKFFAFVVCRFRSVPALEIVRTINSTFRISNPVSVLLNIYFRVVD